MISYKQKRPAKDEKYRVNIPSDHKEQYIEI